MEFDSGDVIFNEIRINPMRNFFWGLLLGCAKSLQILGAEKIIPTPPILLANVLTIPIRAIILLIHPD